jgi:large subunit ribosomal protein L19
MAQYFTYQDESISVGDTVQVHQEITEGDKKRIQIFEGLVIAVRNAGLNKSFTVRKIAVGSIGVEKIMPVLMPSIKKIIVKRHGEIKRAKLYYLRDKVGKAASRVKERAYQAPKAEVAADSVK